MRHAAKFLAGLILACNSFPHTASAQGTSPTCIARNLQPLMETHKIPPYPPEAAESSLNGTTLMRAVIGKDGKPIEVSTVDTSGFEVLDNAAVAWIKQTWLWKPIPAECPSIETRLAVKWSITDIGRKFSSAIHLAAPKFDHPSGFGPTTLDVLFSDTGEMMKVRVANSSGSKSLDDKALEVLKLHKFQPAQVDGRPATSAFLVQVDW